MTKIVQFVLVLFGILSVTTTANAASSITAFVDGRSAPWNSASNPSFSLDLAPVTFSGLPPTVIDSSTGLSITAGDTLIIHYISGTTNGGGPGFFSDANGNQEAYGDLAGYPLTPSKYITSQGPVYFMALLGAFTDSQDAIVGSPFKIGNGPFNALIPEGATKLSMGFNDGEFVDDGGGLTVRITEAASPIPEPETLAIFIAGLGLVGFLSRRRMTS